MKGWEYYGLYWAVVERLHDAGGYLDLDFPALAFALHTDVIRIETLVQDFDLFKIDGTKFTSSRVLDNLQKRAEKSLKAKESINTRWHPDTNVLRTKYDANTIKERKGKESIYKPVAFQAPSIETVLEVIEDRVEAAKFWDFYESKGWVVGKTKMKDWRAAARNWLRNKDKYTQPQTGWVRP